jgi:hypothetical protein
VAPAFREDIALAVCARLAEQLPRARGTGQDAGQASTHDSGQVLDAR